MTMLSRGIVLLLIVPCSGNALADKRVDRVTRIIRALSDKDYKVRLQATFVLGKLGDPRAVPALIRCLDDRVALVRNVAATALGRIGDARAIPALTEHRRDRDPRVRREIRQALRLLRSRKAAATAKQQRARIVLRFGRMKDMTRRAGALLSKVPRIWAAAVAGTRGVALATKRVSPGKELFEVSGSIVRLDVQRRGREVQVSCEVSAVVSDAGGRIVLMASGGATVEEERARDLSPLKAYALEHAVRSAYQEIVRNLKKR